MKEMTMMKQEESCDPLEGCVEASALDLLIKYHDTSSYSVPRLTKLPQGDWIDLCAAESVFIPAGELALISLGISVKLPEGYEAHMLPRSSTYKKWGIIMANNMGIIDESYCGENDVWKFPALSLWFNHEHIGLPEEITRKYHQLRGSYISAGDRICQFRIMRKMPELNFVEVDHLDSPDRGGFGSTGSTAV